MDETGDVARPRVAGAVGRVNGSRVAEGGALGRRSRQRADDPRQGRAIAAEGARYLG